MPERRRFRLRALSSAATAVVCLSTFASALAGQTATPAKPHDLEILGRAMGQFAKIRAFHDTAGLSEVASCPQMPEGYLGLYRPDFFKRTPRPTEGDYRDSVRAFAIRTYRDSAPALTDAIANSVGELCPIRMSEYFLLPPRNVAVSTISYELAGATSERARYYLIERWEANGVTITKKLVVVWRFAPSARRWWVTSVE